MCSLIELLLILRTFSRKRIKEFLIGRATSWIICNIFCIYIKSAGKFLWQIINSLSKEMIFWTLFYWSSIVFLNLFLICLSNYWTVVREKIVIQLWLYHWELLMTFLILITLIWYLRKCIQSLIVIIWLLKLNFWSIAIPRIVSSLLVWDCIH